MILFLIVSKILDSWHYRFADIIILSPDITISHPSCEYSPKLIMEGN